MKIAAYCRVSTEKEAQLNSMDQQVNFFNEFASKNGHELYRIYPDEGISGKQAKNRVEFQKMMEDARRGLFEMVAVKDISRFARNTVDLLNYVRELKSMDIEVQFITNNQTTLGNSEFVLTMFGALAQEESANTSKRVKFGKNITAKKGRVPNCVYGYDKVVGDKYKLTINEEEAKVVRDIFDLYVHKRMGGNKIARYLNSLGLTTKRDKTDFTSVAITRMLRNQLYTGKVTNKKSEVVDFITGTRKKKPKDEWIVVDKPEFRIIDDEIFDKAQKILDSRIDSFKCGVRKDRSTHVFSTLLYCEECGFAFRRTIRQYKNTYVRWSCNGRSQRGRESCNNHTIIDEKELVAAVKGFLGNSIQNKIEFINATIMELEKAKESTIQDKRTVETVKKELSKLKNKKQKYVEMFSSEVIDMEELKNLTNILNVDMEKLESEAKELINKKNIVDEGKIKIIKMAEDLLSDDFIDNTFLKKFIETIEVNRNGEVKVVTK